MDKPAPHIAIAILNYNGQKLLEQYLPSVCALRYPDYSIWVIDNASSDDSIVFLQKEYPQVKLVQNNGNYGFAKGYNEGLKSVEADYYVLLNSDVEVGPGFLDPVLSAMEKDPGIAFAQPKMRWLRVPEYFEYAGAAGGLLDPLGYPLCRGRVFDQLEKDLGQYNDNRFVFWASGACLIARADVFKKLGGFYEYFFMHSEEIDLCWRAQNAGYKILACGESSAMHLGGASLHKENPKKTYYNFRNNLVMLTRNMPVGRLCWLLPARLILDGLASFVFVLKSDFKAGRAVLKGWVDFLKWFFKASSRKFPGKRGFKQLSGITDGFAIWLRYGKKTKAS